MKREQHISGEVGINYAITPSQCRAARALIGISREELAKSAAVGKRTIADFESGTRSPIRATVTALQRALEIAGVEFLSDSGLKLKPNSDVSSGGEPGGSSKPSGSDQDAKNGTLNPAPRTSKPAAPPRKPKPTAVPRSKLDQIRALRERDA